MEGLVDVARLSPLGLDTFAEVDRFRANEDGSNPQASLDRQCNGYWHQIAGLDIKQI
ncbi:putative protease [Vibrio maritimus]|jgi:hypothetical protein|nr:putative protease [Vibrio maritimus]